MIAILLINLFVVSFAVLFHYEILLRLTHLLPSLKIKHRFRIIIGVFGTILAHVLEVMLFGFTYFLMNKADGLGQLHGSFDSSFEDCIYYSFTTYTTLGFGDIEPTGAIRFLTGVESLTGLVLITWSASFLYLEMSKYWSSH